MTLGGGCEITIHGDKARAAAKAYIGLVEVGVGDTGRRRRKGNGLRAGSKMQHPTKTCFRGSEKFQRR